MILEKAWFSKYDPKSIDEYLFENDVHKQWVDKWINLGYIDGNILLSSKKGGTGKTALMRLLSKYFVRNIENIIIADGTIGNLRDDIAPKLKIKAFKPDKKRFIILNELQPVVYSRDFLEFLKNKVMEDYQDNNIFIATTNKSELLSEQLLQRFSYKLYLSGIQEPKNLITRCKTILDSENIKYEQKTLVEYLKSVHTRKSMREIITDLQIFSQGGKFEPEQLSYLNSGFESELINLVNNIFKKIITCKDIEEKRLILSFPKSTIIAKEYDRMIEIINQQIDLEYVYGQLRDTWSDFIPIFNITTTYLNELSTKKFIFPTFIAYFRDCVESIILVNDATLFKGFL